MNPPQPVKNAVSAIWLCIAMSALAALMDRLTGRMPVSEFSLNIIAYGAMVMIPYKLSRRSNVTRIVLAVLVVVTVFLWLGGVASPLPTFSKIASIIQIPIVLVALYWLFLVPSAAEWFGGGAVQDMQEYSSDHIDPKL